MEKINFNKFYEDYSVKRNPIKDYSPFENTMLDFDNGDETEEVETHDTNKVWTLAESGNGFVLRPGLNYDSKIIGFFICKKPWSSGQKDLILE